MGRKKSSTIKGSLRLKYPKKGYDENKEYTLYYEYIWNRQIIRRDTLVRVRVKDWNENANKGIGELRSGFGAAYKKQNT